jgi:hypothetical protein
MRWRMYRNKTEKTLVVVVVVVVKVVVIVVELVLLLVVPGCRSRSPGSIPDTTRFPEK